MGEVFKRRTPDGVIKGEKGVGTDMYSKNPFDPTTHIHDGVRRNPDGTVREVFSVVRPNKKKGEIP